MPRAVDATIGDPRLRLARTTVAELFHFLDASPLPWEIPPGSLAVAFVDEATCIELHAAFFHDDSLTDVMTFPGDGEEEHAGDLAVCPAYAAEHAPDFGHTFAEELTLYLVHGWLHLAGLEDQTEAGAAAMRRAEHAVLRELRSAGRLLEARWILDGAG